MNPTVNEAARASAWREWLPRLSLTLRRLATLLVSVVALALCWRAAEIRPSALFAPDAIASIGTFLRGLFPPDLSPGFLRVVAAAIGRTLAIAIAGTTLSIIIGLPLGLLATATLYRRGVLLAGEPKSAGQLLLSGFSRAIRALLGFLRAVPDLMWGLLFVVAVALGWLAGRHDGPGRQLLRGAWPSLRGRVRGRGSTSSRSSARDRGYTRPSLLARHLAASRAERDRLHALFVRVLRACGVGAGLHWS